MMSRATLAVLLVAGSTTAHADTAGDAALTKVETALNKGKSHYFEYEATTTMAGKADKPAGFTFSIKGAKSLMQFTSPADMKGTKVLVLSSTEVYVYLPAFGKVRRVAANAEGFLGMAFSQDDFGIPTYGATYDAVVGKPPSDKELLLTLTVKATQKTSFPKLELTIARDRNLPTMIKFYAADGKLVKTETLGGYTCESDVCTPGTIQMVDRTKAVTTKLTRKAWKVNPAISDEQFSKRSLEK